MKCILNQQEQEELLIGYLSGSLNSDTTRTYERHLASCPECQGLLEAQKLVSQALAEWEAPAVSSDFDERLWARIRTEEATLPLWQRMLQAIGWQQWSSPMRWALAGAPVAALAIAVTFWPQAPDNSTALNQQIAPQELQEVERTLDDLEALQALHPAEDEKSAAEKEGEVL